MTGAPRGPSMREQFRRRWRRWRKKYGPEVLYTYSLPGPSTGAPETSTRPVLVEIDQELLDDLQRRYPKEVPDRRYRLLHARIGASDQTCWILLDEEGVPAGWCHSVWQDTVNERINHRVRVAPHQVYLYDAYVVRARRRRGLHLASVRARMHLAAARGRHEGLTTITSTNKASHASYSRMGAVVTSRLVYLPPLRRTLVLPVARRSR